MWQFISGNKTYILALIRIACSLAFTKGWLDIVTYNMIVGILEPGTDMALRAGIAKTEATVETTATVVSNQVAHVAQGTVTVSAQVADVKETVAQAASLPPVIIQPGG